MTPENIIHDNLLLWLLHAEPMPAPKTDADLWAIWLMIWSDRTQTDASRAGFRHRRVLPYVGASFRLHPTDDERFTRRMLRKAWRNLGQTK